MRHGGGEIEGSAAAQCTDQYSKEHRTCELPTYCSMRPGHDSDYRSNTATRSGSSKIWQEIIKMMLVLGVFDGKIYTTKLIFIFKSSKKYDMT